MTDVIAASLVASLAGGALSLDRTAAFQTMVSRPIVTAPIVGCLLGSVTTGLVVGTVLELLLMGDLPVGAYLPMHETSIAAATTALSVVVAGSAGFLIAGGAGLTELEAAAAVLPVALCLVFPVAFVYRRVDAYTRSFNARFFRQAAAAMASGRDPHLVRANLKGMVPAFAAVFLSLVVTILPLAVAARLVLSHMPWPSGVMYSALAVCLLLSVGSAVTAVAGSIRSVVLFVVSGVGAGIVMMVMR